jgi:hypothetical protein
MKPKRIQLSRKRGYRKPEGAVVVSRPGRWGNPYALASYQFESAVGHALPWDEANARAMALRDFEHALRVGMLKVTVEDVKRELCGKDLACWCGIISHDEYVACHADVLLSIANDIPMEEVILENTRRAKGETL